MKRNLFILSALIAAMTAVSCVQEEAPVVPENNEESVVFTASFSEGETKATLDTKNYSVAWEAADEVGVLVGDGNYLYTALSAGTSTKLTTEDEVPVEVPGEDTYYAVFPYDAGASLADGVISTTLPAVQTAVNGDFTHHLAVATTSGTNFAFKNVCALVRVTIEAADVSKIVLQGNNNEIVAGGIDITVADEPTWVVNGENGSKTVTLAPSSGTLASGDYYFAILPQTFDNGFKITAYKGEESWVIRNVTASTTIDRAKIIKGKSFFEIEGNGTETNPYLLKNPQDLVNMRTLATLGGETWFKMAKDINMEGVTDYVPVNYDQDYERKIHFDGNNCTISNFYCNYKSYPSLFGVLYGTCKDLKVTGALIEAKNSVAGVIGGYIGTSGKEGECTNVEVQGSLTNTVDRTGGFAGAGRNAVLNNCKVNVTVVSDTSDVGGFFGRTYETVELTGCSATVDLTAGAPSRSRVGGLVGWASGNSITIDDCSSTGSIKDGYDATESHIVVMGGLVGHLGTADNVISNSSSSVNIETEYGASIGGIVGISATGPFTMTNTSSTGTLKGTTQIGGILGLMQYTVSGNVSFEECHSTSSITGKGHYCGGFAGWIQNVNNTSFEDCYATGNVTSTGSSIAGFVGAIAQNSDEQPITGTLTINNCYATGNVTGSNNVGGLVGNKNASGDLTNCYTTGTITGNTTVGGLVGNLNNNGTANLSKCYHSGGDVISSNTGTGDICIGGLVGNSYASSYSDCYVDCDITYTGIYAGGLVGYQRGAATFDKCHFTGDISKGYRHAGGIVGRSNGVTGISNSWASGSLGVSATWSGGLIAYTAYNLSISNSYSNVNVTGGTNAGGLLGQCTKAATVSSSVAWGTVTSTVVSLGAIAGAVGDGSSVTNCYYNPSFTPAAGSTGQHGTAAAAGATISSLATTLGWSTDIWNLTGDVPVLK